MHVELIICIIPNSDAAKVGAVPAPSTKSCIEPIGARMTGILRLCPNRLTDKSTFSTSLNTLGLKAILSRANLFLLKVVSVSDAPMR